MKTVSDIHLFISTSDYYIPHSGYKYDKGRIFIRWWNPMKGWVVNLLATPTKQHKWGGRLSFVFDELTRHNWIKPIPAESIIKLKPHWNKEFVSFMEKYRPLTYSILKHK